MSFSPWPIPIVGTLALAGFALTSLVGSPIRAPGVVLLAAEVQPVLVVSFYKPTRTATVRVRFAGAAPSGATVSAKMAMQGEFHVTSRTALKPTGDGHTLQARIRISMAGAWVVEVRYDRSRVVTAPLKVAL